MSVEAKQLISVEEYLAMERKGKDKHEYLNGEVFAMSGASYNHTLIAINVVRELSTQLKKRPCTVHSADLRVKVSNQPGSKPIPTWWLYAGSLNLTISSKTR
jgi:Uma2 family endonuclease